ncbi:MAG: ABC transporter permease [Deltaproteobacteria bacterium]|nr:ABC transporter permease [Deltaproteobacteria bacterium]
MKLANIAWRNLWRQKRRTILTLISIAFGGFLAILMTAMQDRSWADFIDTAARLGGGHVRLQHPDYLEQPSLKKTVTGIGELRTLAEADPDVETVVERINGQIMLSTATDSFGGALIAYDPTAETEETFSFLEGLKEGEMFQTSKDPGIILGKKLADNLGVEMGGKVVYTMMDKNGEIVAGLARLSGVLGTGAQSLDSSMALLPIDVVRESLGYEADEATHVSVFLGDSRTSDKVVSRLAPNLPDTAAAYTWSDAQPDIASFIAMKVGGAIAMEIIIGLLILAGIFNTLFVSVMERVREFGIMLAIGWSPGQVFKLVMWESTWLALVGLGLTGLVSYFPYKSLSENGIDMTSVYAAQDSGAVEISGVGFDMTLHVGLYPESLVVILVCIVLATLSAGLYPAWRAGRVAPVDSIKLV